MSNETLDVQLADVSRLMAQLSGENAVKDKKKALQDLTRLATLDSHQAAFSQVFERLLLALKPLLGDRALRAPTMGLLGQVGNSSASCFEALVKWHFGVLVQSKQSDKRALRLSQLSDFIQASIKCWAASPSSKHHQQPFLHSHAPSILTYSWNLLDTSKSLDSLATPLLAITSTLATHVPSALTGLSPHFVRAFVSWGSQEISDDMTERFFSSAPALAPFLRLATPSFLETVTTMLQEFASLPLTTSAPSSKKGSSSGGATDSAGNSSTNASASSHSSPPPRPATVSSESAALSAPTSDTSSPSTGALLSGGAAVTEWRTSTIPPPSIATAVSVIRSLVEAIGSSVWRDPKLVFSTVIALFGTAREVHRTNHTFSHRYQWDVTCTQLLASLAELNPSPRTPWDSRTLSLYSFWFGEHVVTFPAMRVSKLFVLLNAHIRFLTHYVCSQTAMPNNMTPFWATEVLALRSIGRNRELAVLVHRMHSLIISQWPFDVDTCEWIPTTVFSHLKHEMEEGLAAGNGANFDQALETLALLDVSLLTSLYRRMSQSPPFGSLFTEAKSQRLATECGRSALKRALEIFPLVRLPKLSPALQTAVIQLIGATLHLSTVSFAETMSQRSESVNIEWEHLLASALQLESKSAALSIFKVLCTGSANGTAVTSSTTENHKIENQKMQKLVSSLLDLLMDADSSIRLETANTLLLLASNSAMLALMDAESHQSIYDQLILFGSLTDSYSPVRIVLGRLLLFLRPQDVNRLGRSKRAARFFPDWNALVPLALDALHPLMLGSPAEGPNLSYFGKTEFSSVLALTMDSGVSQSVLDQSLTSILDVTRVGTRLSSSWIEKLPELTRSAAFGDGNEKSTNDTDSARSASFELAFSIFVTQRLARYATAAKEHWAMWEACIFAVLTKLKPAFANAKEFLAFLESHLMLNPTDTHNGVEMMTAARRRLSWLEKLEKAVLGASPGVLALPTLSAHPAAQFFKTNYMVCADWFVGVRKQAMRFSLKYGTSSDVLRHAFVRLSHLLQQPTQDGHGFVVDSAEYHTLILSIAEGLRYKQDADSLRSLHAFVSSRAASNTQATVNTKRQHIALLEVIRAALLQCSSNFEAALHVYRTVPVLDSAEELTAMVTENMNRCVVSLGNWKEVASGASNDGSSPEAPTASFDLRSVSSALFASLLKTISDPTETWSSQRLNEVQGSLHKILQHFSIEPPHNSQSFGAFVDTALFEAAIAIKAYPTADRSAMKRALEKLETLASPFISSASSNSAMHGLNLLVEKLQMARVVAQSLDDERDTSFGAQNLKSLSLPSLTQLLTLNGLIRGKDDDILVAKLLKKACKTGNWTLSAQLCERLPSDSVDSLLARASILSQKGQHADGLQLLWPASSPSLQRIAAQISGSAPASSGPAASMQSSSRVETAKEMKIGLAICNLLGEGRRDPSVLSFVSSLLSPSSGLALAEAPTQPAVSSSLPVDSLREKLLESLRLPSDLHSRENSNDLECHLSYADAVYSRGTILTKKAESEPLSVVPLAMKETLLNICGGNLSSCEAVLQAYVPQCLAMLMDEQRTHQGASVLARELEKLGVSAVGLDFALTQWASDLVQHLLAPYNRAMQTYSRWLYLSASGALNENFFDRTLRAALRLLRLLTKYGDELLMVSECLDAVPVGVWTHLVPQLISRLGHTHSFVRNHVLKLLIKLATSHPQTVIYQSLVRSGSSTEESSKAAAAAPSQSISAQYRAKPLPTTSKISVSAKTAATSSHSTATKLQREQLTKLKYSLLHLHPTLVSDTQLLLGEFERITFLCDEKALSTVSDLKLEVQKRQKSIQEESTRLQTLYPQIEERRNMLKEKYLIVMRPTVAKLEAYAREIASMLTTSSSTAPASSSTPLKSNPPTPSKPSDASAATALTKPDVHSSLDDSALPHGGIAASSVAPSKFESQFAANVLPVLSKCISYLRDEPLLAADGQGHISVLSLTHAVELLDQLYSRLHKSVRRTSFHLSSVAPRLSSLASLSIPVPGVAPEDGTGRVAVTIQSVEDSIVILASLTRPKKIRLLGSNGQTYTYLLKRNEDLQLDERIMQILSTVNHLLRRDKETRRRGEEARHYSVIPTSSRSGIIQWVNGTTPLYRLFLDHTMRVQKQQHQPASTLKVSTDASAASTSSTASSTSASPKFQSPFQAFFYKAQLKLSEVGLAPVPQPGVPARASTLPPRREWPEKVAKQIFEEMLRDTPSDVFWKAMWAWSGDVETHARTVSRYNRSMATMSIVGYVLGLGDRHLDNLLLDMSTGDVVHIDYNICFEAGLTLAVPEVIPFRLTPNLVTALGVLGLQGTFQTSAQNVMRVLSQSRETLLTMLEAFVYDPLVDWRYNTAAADSAAAPAKRPIVSTSSVTAASSTSATSATSSRVDVSKTIATAKPASKSTLTPRAPANAIPQLRVVLSLFVQRLALHMPHLLSTANTNALRTNITHMYSHAHLLLHSKTEHAKVMAAAAERTAQRKTLEDSLASVQSSAESAKKALEKSKAKLKVELNAEKEAEDSLRNAVGVAQSTFLQTTANALYQLLRPDLGHSGDATDLYAMIVGTLPQFLQPSSLPRPLSAFSTTQQWPNLPITTLSRSKEVSAKLGVSIDSFDASLSRANRLLATYRAIASQLPEGYASLAELENWLGALESTVTMPSAAARDALRSRLAQRYGGSFDGFVAVLNSKNPSAIALTPQERDEFDRARQLITSLQGDITQHTSNLNRAKAKVNDTERSLSNTRVVFGERVTKLADQTIAPPGLSSLNIPELALQHAVTLCLTDIKQEFEKLEAKETANKTTTHEQPINPFLAFLAPTPAPVTSPSLPSPSSSPQKHITAESVSASLQRAFVILAKRVKTATVLCPNLLPAHITSDAEVSVSIADRAEQVILILQSLTSSLSEICSNLNSLTHMDANQAVLEFVNSAEYNGRVGSLRDFFAVHLAPSHPLVTLDRFLALSYSHFADLYHAISGRSELPAAASNFFETEHAKLFVDLTTSPSPSPLLTAYFSELFYKITLDLTFDAIAQRVSGVSFESIVPAAMMPSFNAASTQMQLSLSDCMASSDICARLAWQQAVESMQVEKFESHVSDCQNECARIEWLVDHLVARSGVSLTLRTSHSMRHQILVDLDQTFKELSTALSDLDAVTPHYAHAEEAVIKLMDTRIAQAHSEAAHNLKLSSQSPADPSSSTAQLQSDAIGVSQLEEARGVFYTSSLLRRETLGAVQNVARESLSCISSVLRFERVVRGGRVEVNVCGQEASRYILATDAQDPEVRARYDAGAKEIAALEEKADDLRDKLNVFAAQMDVDDLLTKSFDKEVGIAREQVLPATTATRQALVTNEEAAVEKDLDILFTSIASRSSIAADLSEASEETSLESEIHNTAVQLEKVTAYLRAEIRCLTAPLSHFLLNPSAPPMQIPAQAGSSNTVPFNARTVDIVAGQKRLLDALKQRKRLLADLDKLSQHWLALHPEGDVPTSFGGPSMTARGDESMALNEGKELRNSLGGAPRMSVIESPTAPLDSAMKPPHTIDPAVAFGIAPAPAGASSLVNSKTINILKRIQQKLDNTDPLLFKSLPAATTEGAGDLVSVAASYTQPLPRHSIEEQVNALIAEATSPANLRAMYEGWGAWI